MIYEETMKEKGKGVGRDRNRARATKDEKEMIYKRNGQRQTGATQGMIETERSITDGPTNGGFFFKTIVQQSPPIATTFIVDFWL